MEVEDEGEAQRLPLAKAYGSSGRTPEPVSWSSLMPQIWQTARCGRNRIRATCGLPPLARCIPDVRVECGYNMCLACGLLFLLAIVYVRLDFSITVDAGAEAKMKVNWGEKLPRTRKLWFLSFSPLSSCICDSCKLQPVHAPFVLDTHL